MAKGQVATAATDKMPPRASVHWDGKDVNFKGENPSIGDRVRLVIEGKMSGFSMHEYGNNIDVEAKSVKLEIMAGAEDGESMVELIKKRQKEK